MTDPTPDANCVAIAAATLLRHHPVNPDTQRFESDVMSAAVADAHTLVGLAAALIDDDGMPEAPTITRVVVMRDPAGNMVAVPEDEVPPKPDRIEYVAGAVTAEHPDGIHPVVEPEPGPSPLDLALIDRDLLVAGVRALRDEWHEIRGTVAGQYTGALDDTFGRLEQVLERIPGEPSPEVTPAAPEVAQFIVREHLEAANRMHEIATPLAMARHAVTQQSWNPDDAAALHVLVDQMDTAGEIREWVHRDTLVDAVADARRELLTRAAEVENIATGERMTIAPDAELPRGSWRLAKAPTIRTNADAEVKVDRLIDYLRRVRDEFREGENWNPPGEHVMHAVPRILEEAADLLNHPDAVAHVLTGTLDSKPVTVRDWRHLIDACRPMGVTVDDVCRLILEAHGEHTDQVFMFDAKRAPSPENPNGLHPDGTRNCGTLACNASPGEGEAFCTLCEVERQRTYQLGDVYADEYLGDAVNIVVRALGAAKAKHPDPHGFPPELRTEILGEEVGEVSKALIEMAVATRDGEDFATLGRLEREVDTELAQVGAMSLRWLLARRTEREAAAEAARLADQDIPF